jgi:eukaryotic-like serine/threonine-protein kinase
VYKASSHISDLRVSPNGENVAFVSHSTAGAKVMVLDAHNAARALTREYPSCAGLAWSPSGTEVWFTAGNWGADTLRAAPLSGGGYEVYRSTGGMRLEDIGADGTVLFTLEEEAGDISLLAKSAPSGRNLAWFGDALLAALSGDGQLVAFSDGRPTFSGPALSSLQILVRQTDASPPKLLGEGEALDLSADKRTVLASREGGLVLLPVGAGMPQGLSTPGLEVEEGRLFRDGRRVVVVARSIDSRERAVFLLEVGSDAGARPISEAGLSRWPSLRLSPDERWVAASGFDEVPVLLPIEGGPAIRLPEVSPEHRAFPVGWSAGGDLWVQSAVYPPAQLLRVDVVTHQVRESRELAPRDPTGVYLMYPVHITPDGKSVALSTFRTRSRLFLMRGAGPPKN